MQQSQENNAVDQLRNMKLVNSIVDVGMQLIISANVSTTQGRNQAATVSGLLLQLRDLSVEDKHTHEKLNAIMSQLNGFKH